MTRAEACVFAKICEEFEKFFTIVEKKEIKDSERIIYYMNNKKSID